MILIPGIVLDCTGEPGNGLGTLLGSPFCDTFLAYSASGRVQDSFGSIVKMLKGPPWNYADSSFYYFNYRGFGDQYFGADTRQPIRDMATLLGQQLRAWGVDDNEYDIVAHSLGGAVAAYWSATESDESVKAAVHSIITLDSPVEGMPGDKIDSLDTAGNWVALGGAVGADLQRDVTVVTLGQSAENIDIVTFSNTLDDVVPSTVASLEGACPSVISRGCQISAGLPIPTNHFEVLNDPRVIASIGEVINWDGPFWLKRNPPLTSPGLGGNPLLAAFPGVALVPPEDLGPFANTSLQISVGIDMKSPGTAGYSVEYSKDSGTATVAGSLGEAKAAQDSSGAQPDCTAAAQYCLQYGLAGRQSSPTGELFRGISVRGQPAQAVHSICCADPVWQFAWYDRNADTSYSVLFSDSFDPQLGTSLGSQNADKVRYFAGLAAQFVPAGGRASASPLDAVAAERQALKGFPQPVLLPGQDLSPFASMSIEMVNVSSTVVGPRPPNSPAPRYNVQYRSSKGVASVSGEPSDDGYQRALRGAFGCRSSDEYCLWRISAGNQVERFANLTVNGAPAAVIHALSAPADATHALSSPANWSIEWYDAQADVSYYVSLMEADDAKLVAPGPARTNVRQAQYLAGLAEQFMKLEALP